MSVHGEDQIKTVIFAAEKLPAWIVRGRLHVRRFDKRRQRFDHLDDLHPRRLGVDAHYCLIRVSAAGTIRLSDIAPDRRIGHIPPQRTPQAV
jgi:hypothetical protein